jgi:oxygen-independent coproporphyrinogen III oxidase
LWALPHNSSPPPRGSAGSRRWSPISRCLSCDHHTSVSHDPAAIDRYLDDIEREFVMVTSRTGTRRPVAQLHVGGGTPNYLSERQLLRLATLVDTHFALAPDADVSLEANPARATPGQLELLAGLGFRTIHLELRDLDPKVQQGIGRAHSAAMIRDVFSNAREAGFRTITMDLLYGLPGQSQASIRRTVAEAIALGPDRVACYAYSRRAESFQHQRAIDPEAMPSLGDKLALFNAIAEGFEEAGYVWVGLDSFVRQTDPLALAQTEGRLRRNWIGYTLQETADLFGFGSSAISELDGLCVQNHLDIPRWQASIAEGEFPVRGGVRLDARQQRRREAMTLLMCNMNLRDYAALMEIPEGPGSLSDYERNGLVQLTAEGVSVTGQGRFVLHHLWGDASPRHRWDGVW